MKKKKVFYLKKVIYELKIFNTNRNQFEKYELPVK